MNRQQPLGLSTTFLILAVAVFAVHKTGNEGTQASSPERQIATPSYDLWDSILRLEQLPTPTPSPTEIPTPGGKERQ